MPSGLQREQVRTTSATTSPIARILPRQLLLFVPPEEFRGNSPDSKACALRRQTALPHCRTSLGKSAPILSSSPTIGNFALPLTCLVQRISIRTRATEWLWHSLPLPR